MTPEDYLEVDLSDATEFETNDPTLYSAWCKKYREGYKVTLADNQNWNETDSECHFGYHEGAFCYIRIRFDHCLENPVPFLECEDVRLGARRDDDGDGEDKKTNTLHIDYCDDCFTQYVAEVIWVKTNGKKLARRCGDKFGDPDGIIEVRYDGALSDVNPTLCDLRKLSPTDVSRPSRNASRKRDRELLVVFSGTATKRDGRRIYRIPPGNLTHEGIKTGEFCTLTTGRQWACSCY